MFQLYLRNWLRQYFGFCHFDYFFLGRQDIFLRPLNNFFSYQDIMDCVGNLSALGYPFFYLFCRKFGLFSFGAVKTEHLVDRTASGGSSRISQNNPKCRVMLFPTLCNLIFNII